MFLSNKKDSQVNLINFMSAKFFDFEFIGFKPIIGYGGRFGVLINDVDYAACHIGETIRPISDHEVLEKEQIADGFYTVVLFKGNDNTSYMRRYKEKKFEVIKILNDELYYSRRPTDLYFNS